MTSAGPHRVCSPPAATATPPDPDRIEFTTSTGSGVLEIVDHGWDSDGSDIATPGTLLTVVVRVKASSGVLLYGPDSFQAFDRSGDLFDPVVPVELLDRAGDRHLVGRAGGQRDSGFRHPPRWRDPAESDESSRTVTALRSRTDPARAGLTDRRRPRALSCPGA